MKRGIIAGIVALALMASCFSPAYADPLSDAQKLEGDLRACEDLLDEQIELNAAQNGCCTDLKQADATVEELKAQLRVCRSQQNTTVSSTGLLNNMGWFQNQDPTVQMALRSVIYLGVAALGYFATAQ